jgi:hypothetical protein
MIGWVILAAVLIPALALGRWAERERRWAQTQVRAELGLTPAPASRQAPAQARPRARVPGRLARASAAAGQAPRGVTQRSRHYAER